VLVAAAALAGCSTISSLNPFSTGSTPSVAVAACPTAAVLRPLSQTAVFRPGAAPQPTNVAFYGILSDVNAKCDRGPGVVRASLDVVVIGERGPAAAGASSVDLYYYVAVTGPDQTILSKRTLPVHIDIPADQRRSGITDHIEETIAVGAVPAGQLNIMLGFQQGPEVVDFYRHFRGR
jgi:hypothetical protein